MPQAENALSARVKDDILQMILTEKRFGVGDKLPNEFDLAQELGVSRATLREAVRVLAAQGYLEIHRGKGTYVSNSKEISEGIVLPGMKNVRVNVKDLYEMRLIFEPQAAYYAAKRASDQELEKILEYSLNNEKMIETKSEKWDQSEQLFHSAIASATHNRFITSLLPIFNRAIHSGVILANESPDVALDTLHDHRNIVGYLRERNAEGAKVAMHLHIINTMRRFGVQLD